MSAFPLWNETDRLCSKCRLYLAEPMAWLCQKCREELDGKWRQLTGDIDPDPLELEPIQMPTQWQPLPERFVADPFAFRE